jgi:hypothetical protein
MTDERTLSDDDIRTVTTGSSTMVAEERPGDTDGTDTQDTDGTDTKDTDGTDSQDQDGKDSKDADGTDQ